MRWVILLTSSIVALIIAGVLVLLTWRPMILRASSIVVLISIVLTLPTVAVVLSAIVLLVSSVVTIVVLVLSVSSVIILVVLALVLALIVSPLLQPLLVVVTLVLVCVSTLVFLATGECKAEIIVLCFGGLGLLGGFGVELVVLLNWT